MAGTASYVPSFILMLAILPVFERVRRLTWIASAMRGVGPAVSGMVAVSLIRMAPHALPDYLLIDTLIALLSWRSSVINLILIGSGVGVSRSRLYSLPGVRATLRYICANVGA